MNKFNVKFLYDKKIWTLFDIYEWANEVDQFFLNLTKFKLVFRDSQNSHVAFDPDVSSGSLLFKEYIKGSEPVSVRNLKFGNLLDMIREHCINIHDKQFYGYNYKNYLSGSVYNIVHFKVDQHAFDNTVVGVLKRI